ncbi:unnamed protein product [Brassicogethes aeneus]|uniref:28S ribosomal protein S30, mitochondrial n=1 Tax=Brassicogethes aeneus TaxID=1431903 RepID=A0A9P0B185_BRAAE|nr:unnamed protein product [Brassicogethes aeneus]
MIAKMNLCRVNNSSTSKLIKVRNFASVLPNEEYTVTPQYPPIQDLSYLKRLERRHEETRESIKDVKTVEEKQIRLNMPKYYGFKSYILSEDYIPYNNLPLIQHVTRTHLIVDKELPEYYRRVYIDELVGKTKADIEEAISIEVEGQKRLHEVIKEDLPIHEVENIFSSSISKQINRIIINNLKKAYPHLLDVQVDNDPRVEACWYAGGMVPPENIKRYREGREWTKEFKDLPTDRLMSYEGKVNLSLRTNAPLPAFVNYSEAENPDFDVPFFKYDPRTVGTKTLHKRIVNVPGFWPGDPNQFGILSYHPRGHLHTRERFNDPQEHKEALHRQGILASFAWLSAQANFLGFNTFNDITYPLANQLVITNGQTWSFYAYQLNTMLMHGKYIEKNPKKNICWATPELKLYDNINNGKVEGFNDDVLKVLLKFYGNKPEKRLGLNMTPYLRHKEKLVADYEDDEQREWLEREYKFLVSNRPRLVEMDEMYHWEKIYKKDHKTRFMDKKLRPFELLKKPQDRTLNDRLGKYIPRALRPGLPRNKGRRAREFWP